MIFITFYISTPLRRHLHISATHSYLLSSLSTLYRFIDPSTVPSRISSFSVLSTLSLSQLLHYSPIVPLSFMCVLPLSLLLPLSPSSIILPYSALLFQFSIHNNFPSTFPPVLPPYPPILLVLLLFLLHFRPSSLFLSISDFSYSCHSFTHLSLCPFHHGHRPVKTMYLYAKIDKIHFLLKLSLSNDYFLCNI